MSKDQDKELRKKCKESLKLKSFFGQFLFMLLSTHFMSLLISRVSTLIFDIDIFVPSNINHLSCHDCISERVFKNQV